MVIIKKYSNRRLYDTSQSQYITLDELAKKIREGTDVKVVDAKSSEDLTQTVLTQIIIESRQAAHLLSPELLTQLIRMEQSTLAEFFGQYMTWSMALYQRMKQGTKQLSPLFGQGFANPWTMLANQWDFPPPPASMTTPSPTPVTPEPEPVAQDTDSTAHEVAEMRQELDELKALLRQAIGSKTEG